MSALSDLAETVQLERLKAREKAAQIALKVGLQKLKEYENSGAPIVACAAVQATFQEIATAIQESQ
jgi:hypothetical protein